MCLVCLLLGASPLAEAVWAADAGTSLNEQGPLFTVVTSQRALAVYDRDYYGKHHLVLTFVPAAFTPI